MSEHRAMVVWKRTRADFTYESYNRDHVWRLEGGVEIPASSAPKTSARSTASIPSTRWSRRSRAATC